MRSTKYIFLNSLVAIPLVCEFPFPLYGRESRRNDPSRTYFGWCLGGKVVHPLILKSARNPRQN